MKKLFTILTLIFCFSAVSIAATKGVSSESYFTIDGKKVGMAEMLQILLERNFDLQSQRYDASMADSNYEKFQQKYAAYINAETGYGVTTYPSNIEASTGSEKKVWDTQVALVKAFSSGTTVTGGVANEYTDLSKDPVVVDFGAGPVELMPGGGATHTPALFVSVEQQLLKNGFGVNDRKQLAIMRNGADMQREMLKYQISAVSAGLIIDIWQLALAKESYSNARKKLTETRKVRAIVNENVRLGLSESFEQNYYNALVSGAQIALDNTRYNLEASRRKIRTLLNLDDEVEIGETVQLIKALPDLDESALINTALARRSDYKTAQLQLKSARLEVGLYENEALPELAVSGTLRSYGSREGFGEATGDALSLEGNAYDVRARLTYPLSNPSQKISIRDAEFKMRQAELGIQKSEREIKDDIKSKVDNVKTSFAVYQKTKYVRIQFGVYYNKMQANLRRGRFTAETVKNGLDAYIDSQQNELQALIGYNIALVQLDIATNSIFEKYGIDINSYLMNTR
ncbi:MAG: TolC family protein [Spirochaetes bacterium]|jgi:outer membrane protein TolC|nr:TolC family protein [Spirochaetota bacterium]